MKNEIEYLQVMVDQLSINSTITMIKMNVLKDMVLGVFDEILTEEQAKSVRKKYYHVLEEESHKLEGLHDIVLDAAAVARAKFEFHSYIQESLRQIEKK